jgi:hypothetical protein
MVAAAEVGDRLKDNVGRREMTDLQLYILVAIPLVGILANTGLFIRLSGTMNARFAGLESKMESRFERVDARFDTLMGKVIEIDKRLTRVENRMG